MTDPEQLPDEAPSWKTVSDPSEHADFPGQMLVTRDERTIVEWATSREATPVLVSDREGDRLDTLLLDFPGQATAKGRSVSWEDWLRTFTTSDLRFVFQEQTDDGRVSRYYRLDPSSREEGTA